MQAPVSIRETERVIRVYHYNTVGLLIDRCLDYHLIPFLPIVVEPIQTGQLYISVERKGQKTAKTRSFWRDHLLYHPDLTFSSSVAETKQEEENVSRWGERMGREGKLLS
jgi:hypothetical protein